MTQLSRMLWFAIFVAALLLLPGRATAQSGTVTDDAFVSSNSTTQKLNANGQGISLIVAGSSATVGSVQVGTTTAYIKFQVTSSLPANVAAANVAKATLKLYLSPLTAPTGAIDIYPVASAWSESTLSSASTPTIAAAPFASDINVGNANSFLVVDVTQLVQEWLEGSANGGIANDGIALLAHTNSSYVVFDSKESVVTSHEPHLEIVLVDAGPQGPAGTQGPAGSQGPAGATGPAGAAATIIVGKTTTVSSTTPALVTNTGSSSAAVLNFSIPQGPAGPQGPQGAAGPQGPAGAQGLLGATGAAGAQGPPGPTLPDLVYTDQNNTLTSSQTLLGNLMLGPTGSATTTQGYSSNPLDLTASVSDGTSAHNETFRWQSVPLNNGAPNFGAQLSLLYGGGATPSPTGFFFNANGTINFAPGQTFANAGTLTSVGSGLGLVGGPITAAGTLSIDTTVVPQLGAPSNAFSGNITATSFTGGGAGLTGVNATMVGGLPSSAFALLGAASNSFIGNITASSFSGNSLSLPVTTASGGTPTGGVITLGGTAFAHSFGSGGALGNASGNTFVGSGAGNFTLIPVSATANTGTGFQTLSSISTGYANTASGYSALSSNTTGTYNTAIGANAGVTATSANANTTGSLNTFIGASSGAGLPSASNLQNATAIAANALVSCSKCMVLGDSTLPMMVGIGTNTPSSVFHVVGSQPALSPGNGAAATPTQMAKVAIR